MFAFHLFLVRLLTETCA